MLVYVTSNLHKFQYAERRLMRYGLQIEQVQLEVDEIQSDSIEKIAINKATSAYQVLQSPLVVSDAAWNFPALNGFPGPYMAYIEKWLSAEDFLRLMHGMEDRRVIYTETLVYTDSSEAKVFQSSTEGIVLEAKIKPGHKGFGHIFSFRPDQKSLNQARAEKLSAFDPELAMWDDFGHWYMSSPGTN